MQAIDVVMITKNSESMLEKCLASIYQNVPVNQLIVIDGYSTDNTLNILTSFNEKHGNVKIFSVRGSRARAREAGIAHATTEWFMFVDSDVVLCKDWFLKAQKHIQPDVGAVWGVNIDVIPNLTDKRVLEFQTRVATACFKLRGGTHDTLIRRDLVAGIKIPEELHTYEDAYIINHIKTQGYRAVIGDSIHCMHYKSPGNWNIQNAVMGGIMEIRCGLIYSRNFSYIIYYPFFSCYWFLQISLQSMRSLFPSQRTPQVV
jgi:glycosyltransferase involved in cell wall biosynthesis